VHTSLLRPAESFYSKFLEELRINTHRTEAGHGQWQTVRHLQTVRRLIILTNGEVEYLVGRARLWLGHVSVAYFRPPVTSEMIIS
jgi:hypothetical protein